MDNTNAPAPRKPNATVRRTLARNAYAGLLGMTRAHPEGLPYSVDDHATNYLRDQAGVALGVFLGDLLAETVSNNHRVTAEQLASAVRDMLRHLEQEAYDELAPF
ncbi:hypothetical protein ACFSR9_15200 [Deinococcus taklimakanensis]|uniref:Uncharacterized protein n=1 Tax=Deinococcus taklimakanensis TaxID=536443 RepID=A0ABW5P9H9_9DEIO